MSNNRNMRTMEFDVSDAPMLLHAMAIAAATALMCGHPDARKRFERYKDLFKSFVPPEADLFDEETWGDIGMVLAQAQAFRVIADLHPIDRRRKEKGEYVSPYSTKLRLRVEVDVGEKTRAFETKYGVDIKPDGDPRVKAVHDVLAELAPLDCAGSYHDQFEFA